MHEQAGEIFIKPATQCDILDQIRKFLSTVLSSYMIIDVKG